MTLLRIAARCLLLLLGMFFLFVAFDTWFFPDTGNLYPRAVITANAALGFLAWACALKV